MLGAILEKCDKLQPKRKTIDELKAGMLIFGLGLGLGLKAKFFGLGLGLKCSGLGIKYNAIHYCLQYGTIDHTMYF